MIPSPHKASILAIALLISTHPSAIAQSDAEPANTPKVLVESVAISGTQSIDSTELSEITNSIAGSKFDDNTEELEERLRAQFQDHGYFTATIEKFDIRTIDPLSVPKRVRIEAQVTEGPRCRLSKIDFIGNHVLGTGALRAKFPIKIGDTFRRSKIARGLEGMRKLCGAVGLLDCYYMPDTALDSSSTMKLTITVVEGPQYRMDHLEIQAPAEVAEKLRSKWSIEPGAIFNHSYLNTFLQENHSFFPADFTTANGVQLIKDCPEAKVSVGFYLTSESRRQAFVDTKQVPCSDAGEPSEKSPISH